MGLADPNQALQLISSFHDMVHVQHRFAPFKVKMNPGDDRDQDKILELLRQQAIDPVACCYNIHMQRRRTLCAQQKPMACSTMACTQGPGHDASKVPTSPPTYE